MILLRNVSKQLSPEVAKALSNLDVRAVMSPLSTKKNCCFYSIVALLADASKSFNPKRLADIAHELLKDTDNNRSAEERHLLEQITQRASSDLAKLRAQLSCLLSARPYPLNVETELIELGEFGPELSQFLRVVAKEAVRILPWH